MTGVLPRADTTRTVPDASAYRRRRYLRWLLAGVAMLWLAIGLALAAAGLLGWAPLILLVALPVVLQLSDSVSRLFRVTLAPPLPEPPRLAGGRLASAMSATVVVYPAIIHGSDDVDALLACVQVNRDAIGRGPALHLALVDFADSPHEHDPADDLLRSATLAGLAALPEGPVAVAALFRRRRWNPREGVCMGWERKRGKLEELIGLIGGRDDTTFEWHTPADQETVATLRTMRYVLTIDVGDRLQAKAARRLVGAIAHPDNAAVVAHDRPVVVSGFGFARPIFEPSPPVTLFEWATYPYRPPEGLPSPAQAAFGCDDFLGKGVIDVATYQAVLSGRIPPDRVLSHDRLEGMHARTVAVTDARIVEANVADYLQFRARHHRWVRGDTHLLPWMLGAARLTRLSTVDRIGLARDLLAHLYPVALVTLLSLAWLGAPAGQVGWWTLAILATTAHPVVMTAVLPQVIALRAAVTGPGGRSLRLLAAVWRRTMPLVLRLIRAETARWLIFLAMLADVALVSTDAVIRAGYRTAVSRRHVLQWTTSSRQGRVGPGLWLRIRRLWPTSLFAAALALAAAALAPTRLFWAAPLLLLWLTTPLVAYWSSRPVERLPDVCMT